MPYDLTAPNDLLDVQAKLRGSLDKRLVITWINAVQYAVVDTVLTPLYRLRNGSFQLFARQDDGSFAITMLELAYFTDLETGEALAEFTNPFTQQTGPVPPAVFGPNRVTLTLEGLQPPEHFPFGTLTFDGRLGPAWTDGERLWMREETLVTMNSDNPAFGNYIYNELVTYQGSLADVNDPSALSADCNITYNTTSNWRPWMLAGDTPGHIMSEGFGRKVASIDDLPADYLQLAEQHDPQVLENPVALMSAPPPEDKA